MHEMMELLSKIISQVSMPAIQEKDISEITISLQKEMLMD